MAQQAYRGGCHCGAVRFEVRADLERTVTCNCSLCSQRGYIWTFTPRGTFQLIVGADALTEYRFYKHVIEHRFCRTCGVEPFAFSAPNGSATAMINVRCLDDVNISTLHPEPFDGRAI